MAQMKAGDSTFKRSVLEIKGDSTYMDNGEDTAPESVFGEITKNL